MPASSMFAFPLGSRAIKNRKSKFSKIEIAKIGNSQIAKVKNEIGKDFCKRLHALDKGKSGLSSIGPCAQVLRVLYSSPFEYVSVTLNSIDILSAVRSSSGQLTQDRLHLMGVCLMWRRKRQRR